MIWLVLWGCSDAGEGPRLEAEPTGTDDGDDRYLYDNDGVACVRSTDAGRIEVLVDFGDCLFCAEQDLSCEVTPSADRIEVNAGGTLIVRDDCPSLRSTCVPVSTTCAGPDLADGAYDLVYGPNEVEVALPTDEAWVCTGPSAIL